MGAVLRHTPHHWSPPWHAPMVVAGWVLTRQGLFFLPRNHASSSKKPNCVASIHAHAQQTAHQLHPQVPAFACFCVLAECPLGALQGGPLHAQLPHLVCKLPLFRPGLLHRQSLTTTTMIPVVYQRRCARTSASVCAQPKPWLSTTQGESSKRSSAGRM